MSPGAPPLRPPEWSRALRLLGAALVWFTLQQLSMRYGALALPRSLAAQLSLELYLTLAQVAALAFGLVVCWLVLRGDTARELGLTLGRQKGLVFVCLLAPALYALSSYLAVYLALPTLIAEIRQGGASQVRANAGEFGRTLVSAPLGQVLLWSVVVSPLGEELLFRGALWGALARLVEAAWPGRPGNMDLPAELLEPSALERFSTSVTGWLRRGGAATLISAALFGALHADMPGGQGIIRVTAAGCLGLATGLARQASGSVVVCVLLHALFNALGLAGARRWIVTETLPTHYMVPTLATALGAFGAIAAIALALGWRRSAPSSNDG